MLHSPALRAASAALSVATSERSWGAAPSPATKPRSFGFVPRSTSTDEPVSDEMAELCHEVPPKEEARLRVDWPRRSRAAGGPSSLASSSANQKSGGAEPAR